MWTDHMLLFCKFCIRKESKYSGLTHVALVLRSRQPTVWICRLGMRNAVKCIQSIRGSLVKKWYLVTSKNIQSISDSRAR